MSAKDPIEGNVAELFVRSCEKECSTPIRGEQTGKIPTWLSGDLLRNGGGLYDIGESRLQHLFDGMAFLHRFHLDNGAISYSNKFLRSDRYNAHTQAQRLVISEFGTVALPDPCKSLWEKLMTRFIPKQRSMSDNCGVTICSYGDQVYAATESPLVWRISKELDSLEKVLKSLV